MGLIACDDDGDDDDDGAPLAAATVPDATVVTDTPNAVTAVATDYRFDGLPATTPVGTQFNLQNDSTKEVHEMVIVRIPDEVTETVGQLLALPEEELDAKVGDIEPSAVIVALPGETGRAMEGDGIIDEPGRYAVLCFIPVGADPEMIAELMEGPPPTGNEQPPLGDGPPHIMEGMYAEIVVE